VLNAKIAEREYMKKEEERKNRRRLCHEVDEDEWKKMKENGIRSVV
jgi:hypothetical protein